MRNAIGGVCLAVVLLLFGETAFNLAREHSWLGVAAVAGVMATLLLLVLVSQRWRRFYLGGNSTKTRSKRKRR